MNVNIPAPPPWLSPSRWVARYLPFVAYTVIPDKAGYAYQLFGKKVSLAILDSDEFILEVDLETGEISVSRFACELYWSAAYAYVTVYQRKFQGRIAVEPLVHDLRTEDTRSAVLLLQWVVEKWVNRESTSWPESLPRPLESPEKGSMENVADELALTAFGVLLHHEAAHRYLEHQGRVAPTESIARERDADAHAVDLILGGLDEKSAVFNKRALGVVLAFGVLAAKSLHEKHRDDAGTEYFSAGGKRHPRRFDRLFNALDRHIKDPNHDVWGVVVAMLKLHLDNSPVGSPSSAPYPTFRACAEAYVEHAADVLHWEGGDDD